MPSQKEIDKIKKLPEDVLLRMHDLMVKSRVLEDRQIKLYQVGKGYFWIGGTGEEAFGVPLGMLAHKGEGPEYDYFHLHYRGGHDSNSSWLADD